MIFHEEYARADAPARVNHLGEELLGPTLIAFGTDEQKQRFLPTIVAVEELWCQGYSEPGAGSDLANVSTKARLDGDEWVIDGQKVWTSLAHQADWCFVVARTEPGSKRHHGLSYLLVPMDQAGIEVRPIIQLTGTSEFNEVFFSRRTHRRRPRRGRAPETAGRSRWPRSASSAASPRSASRSASSASSTPCSTWREPTGRYDDPVIRDRLAQAQVELEVIRLNALRTLSEDQAPQQASISKLLWAGWHRTLGELAMQVRGARRRCTAGRRLRPRRVAAAVPVHPRGHDLRRVRRDPAQRPGRARARPTQRTETHGESMTATRPEQPTPDYVPGHDLLRDKVVVVTAAAGAGIGAAVVRRVLEEGARAVVLGDTHERRLGEARGLARRSSARTGCARCVCDVTDEDAGAGAARRRRRSSAAST